MTPRPLTPERLAEIKDGINSRAKQSVHPWLYVDSDNIAAVFAAEQYQREQAERLATALKPFAAIGQWFFARPLPDDTPVVHLTGINGMNGALTRGDFKAAHSALAEETTP